MYGPILILHSLLRWAVLAAAVTAVVRAAVGTRAHRAFAPGDARAGLILTILIDTQALFGLLLYFVLSPLTRGILAAFGSAMKDNDLRFWAAEHGFLMITALVTIHVGRVRQRKAPDDQAKHRTALIWFGIALVAMTFGVPWPWMSYGRALIPAM